MATPSKTMRSLAVLRYGKPSTYQVLDLPIPEIKAPNEVLVKIHAAAIETGDTQRAYGALRVVFSGVFPIKIGVHFSGTVVSIGSAVTRFQVSDEVFGCLVSKGPDFMKVGGSASEYAIGPDNLMALKPAHTSHVDAASLSGAMTAIQCFRHALSHLPGNSLEGKTVFVPGALSGTGSIGCQIAKNVYGAAKVITTVSTKKVPLVDGYLGDGCVDQIIDYKTEDILEECPAGSVDFLYNTHWQLTSLIPLVKPKTGVIVSIASAPTSATVKEVLPSPPFFVLWILGLINLWYSWKLWGTGIHYAFISGSIVADDLETVAKLVEEKKLKAVVGKVAQLEDIDTIREACQEVFSGKGGLGKFVIKIVQD